MGHDVSISFIARGDTYAPIYVYMRGCDVFIPHRDLQSIALWAYGLKPAAPFSESCLVYEIELSEANYNIYRT